VSKLPDWHRPKLTETQLNGEEKRLAARNLFPKQVRADLIRALASMDAATITAACRALGEAVEISEKLIDNILNGRMPIYDTLLIGLYGPAPRCTLPDEWASPADFGPLLPPAIKAGLVLAQIESAPGVEADTPTPVSPDPDAGALSSPGAPPAPVIVAQATTPQPSDDLPAASATSISRAVPDAAPESAAPPAFFPNPVLLRAPDAASPAMSHRPAKPVQLREVGAADHSPPPPPTNFFPSRLREGPGEGASAAPPPTATDPLAIAESLLAGRLNAAIEEADAAQRHYLVAEQHARNLRTAVAELVAARFDVAKDQAAA